MGVATKVFQFLAIYDSNSKCLLLKAVSPSLGAIQGNKYVFLNG